ncbi:LPS biosynthesis protein [Propionigenium maris DSM 9537]|uniref:LPS biosynthesis protein n=1 Tax=Propionigenium maris DSM 9537 TaxID=1123000 RepID=A0A9W6LMQ8_9FUSO|nr:lipopolysaccharide biosynthesis protein [Propionigenium maris]GLI55160.1 LPS biosynthesis protein [Propionigenium maris DSM 9537]
MIKSIQYKDYKIFYLDSREDLTGLGKEIIDGRVEIFQEFKVTKRNYVAGALYKGEKYVVKSPRNEHRIPQRKVQTLFKEGEALTTLKNVNELIEMGFHEFVSPLMAIVKRSSGMIVDSFLVMEYVEGRRPERDEISLVVDFGKRLHEAKHYHGDFNTSNFLMTEDGLKTIDTQGKGFSFGSYRKHYEVMTFSKDLLILELGMDGEKLFNYPKDGYYYLAHWMRGFKNLSVVSEIKRIKKKLRDKGWKI